MSATLPPTAGLDRPSDYGEFWQQADMATRMNSMAPDVEPATQALTPAQNTRRKQLQGMVAGVISALLTFTVLAAGVYGLRRHHEAALVAAAAAKSPPPAATPASFTQLVPAGASPSGSAATSALALKAPLGAPARPHAGVARPKPARTRAARPSLRKPSAR